MTKTSKIEEFIKFNVNQQKQRYDYCTHMHHAHFKKKVTLLYPERNWNIYSFKNYFLDINTELSIHSSLKVSKEKKWFHSNKLSTICSGIRITSKGTRKLMHIHEFFWKEQILHVRQCHWRANPRQKHSLRTAPWTCCRL